MKRIALLLIVLLPVLLFTLAGGAAASLYQGPVRLEPGITDRGYMLSANSQAVYTIYTPDGMTVRPRIAIDPASPMRLKARLDLYSTVLVDDDCDDAVIDFTFVSDGGGYDMTLMPCPGALDVDTPFFVSLDYDPVLQEQEPNDTASNQLWIAPRGDYKTYHGTIVPTDDIDRYYIGRGLLFMWTGEHIGQPLHITMTQRDSNVQPGLTLYGRNTHIDATTCGSRPGTACIEVTLTEYVDYILEARSESGQGGYTLEFDLPNFAGEPDDTPDTASNTLWGVPDFQAIDPVGDVDYHQLAAAAGPPWETNGDQGRVLRVSFNFGPAYTLPHLAVAVIDPTGAVIYNDVLSADHPFFDFLVPAAPLGQYYLRLSDADNGAGDPDAIYYWGDIEWVGPYVSADLNGLGGRFARMQGDLLIRTSDNKGFYWALVFDASDVGITQDVVAAEFLPNGTLLLALGAAQTVPGLGKVLPQDIIRFVPYYRGDDTAGVFEWYLDGSDVGLTTAGEKIDAITLTTTDPDDFAIAVSLSGSGSVPKTGGGALSVADEDLIRLDNPVYGATSGGAWSLFTDGSALPGMTPENLNGATRIAPPTAPNPGGQWLWLIKAGFNIDGFSGDGRDVLNVWQGPTPAGLDALGLSHDNLGDKRLDAITIGPALED